MKWVKLVVDRVGLRDQATQTYGSNYKGSPAHHLRRDLGAFHDCWCFNRLLHAVMSLGSLFVGGEITILIDDERKPPMWRALHVLLTSAVFVEMSSQY